MADGLRIARWWCLVALLASLFPALGAAYQDRAALRFEGEYRTYSKTSIVRNLHDAVKPARGYSSVQALLDSLPQDSVIRKTYKNQGGMPEDRRVLQELKNVSFTCWIHAVKFEGGENGDNDFHVVVGTSADTADRGFLNVEISGLPPDDDIDFGQLKAVRKKFLNLLAGVTITGEFTRISPPRKVKIKGSLFFDAQHGAGCKACPGPSWAKPQTVWELHPVYSLTPAN